MDPQRWEAIRALFDELVELAPAARGPRLTEITDPELRESVESLLAADAEVDERLGAVESPFLSPAVEADPSEPILDPFGLTGLTLSHFRVLGPLEAGGMGVVYRAEDIRLNRIVALKFLLPQYHLDSSAKERFLHEARSVAALDHPNLCTVYEVGESEDGRLFLAMSLYPGETLKARLARQSPLPVEEALEIAQQIALGLACAHEAGIVHRDLKPGNLMLLPGGTVKILDFGLAKARDLSLTGSAATLGTVAYMAPEQIRGEEITPRTDLWGLGVVLYEMLTGKRPFGGGHELSIAHAIAVAEPARPSELRAEIPPGLEEIILTLLQKDPARRYATAGELREDLAAIAPERGSLGRGPGLAHRQTLGNRSWLRSKQGIVGLVAAGAVLVAAVVGLTAREIRRDTGMDVPMGRSVAVLPFESRSTESGNEYLASGLHDEIIAQLTKLRDLRVISLNSVLGYAGTTRPLRQVGRELGVDAMLEGSVQRSGERVRVSARLVDSRTGEHLWAESYDRELDDLFAIQTEIAGAIVGALRNENVLGADRVVRGQRAVDGEAYRLYLQGRYLWNQRTEPSLTKALEFFRAAIERDPDYALAYAGLADTYLVLGGYDGVPTSQRLPLVASNALRAIELDPTLGEPHAALAKAHDQAWEWDAAEREYRRALELNPGYATAYHWYSMHLRVRGRPREALAAIQKAKALDPLSLVIRVNVADTHLVLGDLRAALAEGEEILALQLSAQRGHLVLGLVNIQAGRYEEAATQLERALALGGERRMLVSLGVAYARAGRRADALGILERMRREREEEELLGVGMAAVYTALGDHDQAFRWLEQEYAARSGALPNVRWNVHYDSLRNDPRYHDLLRRMGLDPD